MKFIGFLLAFTFLSAFTHLYLKGSIEKVILSKGHTLSSSGLTRGSKLTHSEQKFLIYGIQNIKNASTNDIDAVPYISKTLAKKIYQYIQNNEINSLEELIKIKGVGPKTIERLEKYFEI